MFPILWLLSHIMFKQADFVFPNIYEQSYKYLAVVNF